MTGLRKEHSLISADLSCDIGCPAGYPAAAGWRRSVSSPSATEEV
jgi:hypothetical protein